MKTNALISFAVTAKLICAFVSAYKIVGFPMQRLIFEKKIMSGMEANGSYSLKPNLEIQQMFSSSSNF